MITKYLSTMLLMIKKPFFFSIGGFTSLFYSIVSTHLFRAENVSKYIISHLLADFKCFLIFLQVLFFKYFHCFCRHFLYRQNAQSKGVPKHAFHRSAQKISSVFLHSDDFLKDFSVMCKLR